MKKTLFAVIMSIIMISLASCGGNKHSKAFNESKSVLDKVMENVEKAETCDDLDMAAFGIFNLLTVEGVDAIPETEQQELTKITEKIDEVMEAKKAEFGCQDEDFFDDDETPLDEEVEELE